MSATLRLRSFPYRLDCRRFFYSAGPVERIARDGFFSQTATLQCGEVPQDWLTMGSRPSPTGNIR